MDQNRPLKIQKITLNASIIIIYLRNSYNLQLLLYEYNITIINGESTYLRYFVYLPIANVI